MKNKNTDLIAYGSYDIYIGRFLCLAYTIITARSKHHHLRSLHDLFQKVEIHCYTNTFEKIRLQTKLLLSIVQIPCSIIAHGL
jgi:hypothetical protein